MLDYQIYPFNPHKTPSNVLKHYDNTLPSWIKTNTPATIFTDGIHRSKRGTLVKYQNSNQYLHMVRGTNRTPILLIDLHQNVHYLLRNHQLTCGHPPFHTNFNNRCRLLFTDSVSHHVYVANLRNFDTPTLLKMNRLETDDKNIWKQNYDEEYYSLQNLPSWTTISSSKYKKSSTLWVLLSQQWQFPL